MMGMLPSGMRCGAGPGLLGSRGAPQEIGYRLSQRAIEAGLTVFPVPGASAPMAALRSVGSFFVLLAETNSRVKAIEHLNTLSDAQLAERGIKTREDIARHVFRDLFYV